MHHQLLGDDLNNDRKNMFGREWVSGYFLGGKWGEGRKGFPDRRRYLLQFELRKLLLNFLR